MKNVSPHISLVSSSFWRPE